MPKRPLPNERPPFSFADDEGELQGFDVEIAWALCATSKSECQLVPLEFTALLPALEEGRIDAAVASMSITEERLRRVDFTDKYYQASNRFVARRGAFSDITPSGLAGKTIGVKRGTIHDRYLSDTSVHDAIGIWLFRRDSRSGLGFTSLRR
jgi:ABC-type amino acid transport substrate-binding protein